MTHDATVDCDLEEMPGDFVVFFVGRGPEWRLLGFSRKVLVAFKNMLVIMENIWLICEKVVVLD